jgi:exodeoxyribonuclease-5
MSDFAEVFGWPTQLSPAAARRAEEAERMQWAAKQETARAVWQAKQTEQPAPPLPPLEGEQVAALDTISAFLGRNEPYFVLHGLAGTGKTTVLAHLARARKPVILATPTGKAATVLGRKTGTDATTLHRMLYIPKVDDDGNLIGFELRCGPGDLVDWLVLVDEASMVGTDLARDLLATGAHIVAAGDPGQLPPVEQVPFFTTPDFVLQDIRRQAAGSPIIRQAHAVRAGQPYAPDGEAFQVIDRHVAVERIDWADIVLCWRNETRHRMNAFMRRRRGIAPDALPQPGEPLMCLHNQPNGMMNGEIFTVHAYDRHSGLLLEGEPTCIRRPWFEWRSSARRHPRDHVPFALAYCVTVHKAQGSEWSHVLVLDEFSGEDRGRWLYTAITRASEAVCIVPQGLGVARHA